MFWYNPNKTLEQGITDCRECYYDSSKAVAPIGSGISAGMQAGFLLNSCMKARGYMQISEEILPSKLRKASVPIDTFNSMKVAGR